MASIIPSHSSTHGPVRDVKGTKIEPYYPPSTYKTFGAGIDHPLSDDPGSSIESSTLAFIKEQLQLDDKAIKVQESYSSDVAHHAYVDQLHDGIPFFNVRANVAFNLRNKIIAFGSSFVKLDPDKIASSKPGVSAENAIKTAENNLEGEFHGHSPKLGYLAKEDGSAILAHNFQIKNEAANLDVFVDAHSGKLALITDLISHASIS